MASSHKDTIKTRLSSNNFVYHSPDSPEEVLRMIAKHLRSIPEDERQPFLQDYVERHCNTTNSRPKFVFGNSSIMACITRLFHFGIFQTSTFFTPKTLYAWNPVTAGVSLHINMHAC
jgi:hypothetical protein